MSTEITIAEERHDWICRFSAQVKGVAPLQARYSSYRFRPTHVLISYEFSGDGWRFISARITGFQVRKDGSDSMNIREQVYSKYDLSSGEAPDWLQKIATDHLPKGIPS